MVRFPPISSARCGFFLRRAKLAGVLLVLASVLFFRSVPQAHASGGGPPPVGPDVSFVHTATSANTHGDFTLLNEPEAASSKTWGTPIVTADWNPGGVYTGFDGHQVGVVFLDDYGFWAIMNEDQASMPIGASFNVYMVGYGLASNWHAGALTVVSNGRYITAINDPATNGNPSANILVSQVLIDGYNSCPALVYNNHPIGTWYAPLSKQWTIYNEDIAPIPACAEFNYLLAPAGQSLTQVATAANTRGDSTCINTSYLYDNPNAIIFINHTYMGSYFTDVSAVWYNINMNEWCIFDGSFNVMPIGATFTVVIME